MSLSWENYNEPPGYSDPSDNELREMLEAAERRKQAEWDGKGRTISVILLVPIVGFIAWATIFLIRYPDTPAPIESKPVAKQSAPTETEDPQFDAFRPKALRVGKQEGGAEQPSGQIIDKGDIEFAMQLLNYVQPPAKPEPKH